MARFKCFIFLGLLVSFFYFGFLSAPVASASTLPSQSVYTTSFVAPVGGYLWEIYNIGVGTSTIFNFEQVESSTAFTADATFIQSCTYVGGNDVSGCDATYTNGTDFTLTATSSLGGHYYLYHYDVNTSTYPYGLLIDEPYLKFTRSGGFGALGTFPSTTAEAVFAGNTPLTAYNIDQEIRFNVFSAPPSLSLNFPKEGSTTPDFANWIVSSTNSFAGTLQVVYGLSTSTMTASDTITYSPFVNTNPVAVTKAQPLYFPPLVAPVHYFAQAQLFGTSTSVFSPITDFYIDPNAAGGETSSTINVPATNCNATSSSFWDTAVVDVQNGVCIALTYLFIPNTTQQSDITARFNNLSGHISTKPPLGYFNLVENDLNSLAIGTSSVVLLNATATTAFAAVISPVYAGITYLLWFLFALWLFNRLRHFNFQS